MSQSSPQVSTCSVPVAATQRHCEQFLLCSAVLYQSPILTTGIVSFSSQNSISLLHNVINCIGRLFHYIARERKKNGSRKTMDSLSDGIALLRKIGFQGSGFNSCANDCQCECLSRAQCVMTKWTVCVMSSEPSGTLLSAASIISDDGDDSLKSQSMWISMIFLFF